MKLFKKILFFITSFAKEGMVGGRGVKFISATIQDRLLKLIVKIPLIIDHLYACLFYNTWMKREWYTQGLYDMLPVACRRGVSNLYSPPNGDPSPWRIACTPLYASELLWKFSYNMYLLNNLLCLSSIFYKIKAVFVIGERLICLLFTYPFIPGLRGIV